ncbi:phage tail tape measure protein [Fibrella aquatilis]|uniref:Phage tail tape measure protein n=1 Tax=Fibrella aquatilis TaxID=2817059 RepID=A0A939K1W5_9BACT|nr:phage tail tape measure protein [Fibrella aquatilis]MBO0933938.1 phage tail tape measure protein [Fibrella aquatilis]
MQDEIIKLRTEIDTDEASVSLEGLKSDLRDVKRELREMGQVSEDWSDEQKQAYAELKERQKDLNAEIKEYTQNIDLNDASVNELKASLRLLVSEQNQLTAGSEEWIEKTRQVNQVKERLEDVREEANLLGRALDDQKGVFDKWNDSFMGTFAALQFDDLVDGVMDFGRESVESAAKTSDAFADIQKSTGQTTAEVEALNDELRNIDTRSTQEALLDIVKVGGQLGIAKEEIKGFTESVDKANVALGDEFSGGAEEVANTMGTLSKLFRETKDLEAGKAINDIGSAINELGAAGSATGPVVADFATRIGQLGDLAPEIGQTLGLGAAFQELGLSAEISAGGITNILLSASKATELFAEQLGISEVEMKKLINTNPNEFLLQLAQSLQGLPADQVAKRLDDLGIKSQEATKVMSLLKDQTQLVRDRQLLANKAMQEGTSLTKEFSIKNETAAAQLDKFGKVVEVIRVEVGNRLLPVLIGAGNALLTVGRVLMGIPAFVSENRVAIGLLVVGLISLNANLIRAQVASLAGAAATKAQAIASAIATAAESARAQAAARAAAADQAATVQSQKLTVQERLAALQTTASNLLTQAKIVLTNGWTVAQTALNNALRANPIGIVITVLAVLAAALVTAYQRSETFRGIVNGVWAALKVGWQAITDLTGAFVSFIGEALAPLQPYFSSIGSAMGTFWNLVRTGAGYVVDLHKAVFGLAVDALGGLLDRVAPVKTAIAGLWNTILGGVEKVKEAANAVAEFLHIDGLVARAKETGQKMGTAFKETYQAELAAARAKDNVDHDAHHAGQTAKAGAAVKQQASDKKEANSGVLRDLETDNGKHRESEAKKEAEHTQKLADERKKANADAVESIAKKNIELIQDDQARKLAQLAFERDQERKRIDESKADQKMKADQLSLLEKSYQADVAATQKDFRDKKEAAETAAMKKYLDDKEQQAQKERSLFTELADYEKATRSTNQEIDLSLTKLTENQKFDVRKQQMADALTEQKASILKEYTAKVTEITNNISDNDQRMKALKTLNDWKNSQLNSADTKHAKDMTTLNQEHLATRQQNTKEFFGAVEGLMNGDYTSFMDLLGKKLKNEKAANQQGLQDFAKKSSATLDTAGQVVGAMQKLNQKYLEDKLNKLAKEKSKQLADWDEQYKKGKINKETYEKGIDKINKEFAEKEKAEKLKAWKRDQAMQIAMALINTAQAVIKSLAMMGWPLGLIGAAVSGVMGGIQIAMIKNQQPPSFEKGGFVNGGIPDGPAHGSSYGKSGLAIVERTADGGYGEEKGEMEGGEPVMILSRNLYKNNGPIIDRLLHSSLHRNGAPIFRSGGLMGSDGGSYSDYLKPLRKGKMYASGSEMADSGGGDDFGTGSPDEAADTTADTEQQIDQSMKLMEDIAKNTLATTDQITALMTYLNGTFLSSIANQAYYTRWQIQNTGYSLENSQNREATRMIGEMRTQGNATRGLMNQLINQTRTDLLLELRRLTDANRNQNAIIVSELQRQGNLQRNDQARQQTTLVSEIQRQGNADRSLDERQHQNLVQTLLLMYAAASTAAGSRHTTTTNQLNRLYADMSDTNQKRYVQFINEIRNQLNTLNANQASELRGMANEMKRQASALISETKSQTSAMVGSLDWNTNRVKSDLGWQSYLLKIIADKQWSVSVNNVVQVWTQVNVINKDSNLR